MNLRGYRNASLAALLLLVLAIAAPVWVFVNFGPFASIDNPVMSLPIDVSSVGEKYTGPVKFEVSGNYLLRPKIDHSVAASVGSIPRNELLIEIGKSTEFKVLLLCKGEHIPVDTQKIHTGVLGGFNVPKDVPLGRCEEMSIRVTESDVRFREAPGLLLVELVRIPK